MKQTAVQYLNKFQLKKKYVKYKTKKTPKKLLFFTFQIFRWLIILYVLACIQNLKIETMKLTVLSFWSCFPSFTFLYIL